MAFAPHFPDRVTPFIVPGDYLHTTPQGPGWMTFFRTSFSHGGDRLLTFQGEAIPTFDLALNTVLAVGSDPLCLFAKFHAQCEIHAWVEGANRTWMADLIQQGLDSGLYRQGVGWDAVLKLLRASVEGPVVTSYSVTESFPNAYVAEWVAPTNDDGEPDDDAWYDLPDGEQWDLAIAGLRRSRQVPALSPEILRARFGRQLTLIDIFGQEVVHA